MIITLDPGLRASGLALFKDSRLVEAELVTRTSSGKLAHRAHDCADTALRCHRAAQDMLRKHGGIGCLDRVVLEWPQIYQRGGTRTKGDPNDLLPLAGICSAFKVLLGDDVESLALHPAEWKGQLDGDVMLTRITGRLDDAERRLVPGGALAHNVIDAIGIGLHHLGRLQRTRAYRAGGSNLG